MKFGDIFSCQEEQEGLLLASGRQRMADTKQTVMGGGAEGDKPFSAIPTGTHLF